MSPARILLLAAAALALPAAADYSTSEKAPQLYALLRGTYGFTAPDLASVKADLKQAKTLPQLIHAEQNNKEKVSTWDEYVRIHVTQANIDGGLRFMREQQTWLARAERDYGVPPPVITALLGVETKFGTFTGRARVLDALATQGFDHPTRAPFFFDELAQYFVLCRDERFDATEPRGSYAGAMGDAQFMPSNYRRLAVDFDGNGRRDLWSAPDAIGSIANYLAHYDPARSYRRGEPLVVRAQLAGTLDASVPVNGKLPTLTVAQLRAAGITPAVELPADMPAGLVRLDRADGAEYWVALPNFYSVMSYNPRVFYAMSVTQLAMAMTEAQGAAAAVASQSMRSTKTSPAVTPVALLRANAR